MNLLLIEDDEIKREQITAYIENKYGSRVIITERKSLQSAKREIIENSLITCILLDMSMPRFDYVDTLGDDEFLSYAGELFLIEMKRRKIKIPVYVVTAYDLFETEDHKYTFEQLDEKLKNRFSNVYEGMVYFSSISDKWKNSVARFIDKYMETPDDKNTYC